VKKKIVIPVILTDLPKLGTPQLTEYFCKLCTLSGNHTMATVFKSAASIAKQHFKTNPDFSTFGFWDAECMVR